MPRSALLTILMFWSIVLSGQNISVTFTGTGETNQVDSVTATNLTTNQSVTLPGNDTLVLTSNTGIPSVFDLTASGIVYPNPFPGKAILSMVADRPQAVYLKLLNMMGQIVAQTEVFVQPGDNEFSLCVTTSGIYSVGVTTEQGTICYKVICTDATESVNSIQCLGAGSNNHNYQNNHNNPSQPGLKTSQTDYTLGYTSGEIILYKCYSGIYTTIVTDSLISSKNYEVEFDECTDSDGKNYSIVMIGEQTWMAENLAYLPAVSLSSAWSETDPYYFVYGYEGSIVSEAKATEYYTTYGVLYNWPAALSACPAGWHLPTDEEWKILEKNQGMSEAEADTSGWRYSGKVGGKFKESGTTHWSSPNTGATNSSGFTAFPGGFRDYYGSFLDLGYDAHFWSSSLGADGWWACSWSRSLTSYNGDSVFRADLPRSSGFSVRCLKGSAKPTASFTYSPAIGTPKTNFQFDASGSADAETTIADLEVRWDWNGDSIWDTDYGKVKTHSHQYSKPGSYSVILEVKDGDGVVDTDTKQVIVEDGSLTDDRDGREYVFRTIGTQTWMIENLAYLPAVSPSRNESLTSPVYYAYGYEGTSVSAAKATVNYATYGVLYNWEAARTSCPDGWRLPSDDEWTLLTDFLGASAGTKMKTTSGWLDNGNGDNSSGFSALPGGYRNTDGGGFYSLGINAYFWSSSELDMWYVRGRNLEYDAGSVGREMAARGIGFSVRCLKGSAPQASFTISPPSGTASTTFQFDASGCTDFETPAADLEVRWDWNGDSIWDTGYDKVKTISYQFASPGSYRVILQVKDADGLIDNEANTVIVGEGTLTDSRDGHEYAYKAIGTQTWMLENLAYLPAVSPASAGSETSPFYYVYGYEGESLEDAKSTVNYATYGVLYNWEAAKTACPSGWHLPSDDELTLLIDNLGESAGGQMKESGTLHWSRPNTGATNASGFTALPGGYRFSTGVFYNLRNNNNFWSSSANGLLVAWYRRLIFNSDGLARRSGSRSNGFSVRCLRD